MKPDRRDPRDLPTWANMSQAERRELLSQAVELIAQGRALPDEMVRILPREALELLGEVIEHYQKSGLAGPNHTTTERLKAIVQMMKNRGAPRAASKSADDFLLSLGPDVSTPVLANEAALVRQSEAMGAGAMERQAAALANPMVNV